MTDLKSVLKALNESRKLQHWDKPPREFGPDNPEDSDYNRNGLKDVGDLSKISFSSPFSFGIQNKEEDETEEEWPETSTEIECKLEDAAGTLKPPESDSLEMARMARDQYRLALMMQALAVEEECQQKAKEKSRKWREAYLNKLNKIRAASENEWAEYILKEEDRLAYEENRIKEQVEEAQKAVDEYKNEYNQHINNCSSVLMDAFERAQRQEAEAANIRRHHLKSLQGLYSNFLTHVTQMRDLYKDIEGRETFDSDTENLINRTVTKVEEVFNTSHQGVATEEQIVDVQAALDQSFTSVKEITQSLHVKKEEKEKLEQERLVQEKAAQEAEANKIKSEVAVQRETSEALEPEFQTSSDQEEKTSSIVADGSDTFIEMQERVKRSLDAKDEVDKNQIFKIRNMAKRSNQLNVNDQNINRNRLQLTLNAFARKELEPGTGCVNTDAELLYLKSLVVENVIKLGTWSDKATTAVNSWFITSIIAFHPDVSDIYFYRLFKECLGLVQVVRNYPADYSLDHLHQIMGRKENERADQFSVRNGNCAFMYGIVLAMMYKKKKGLAEQAAVKGWQLLAKMLSAPPIACITGEIILEFLKAFGFVLQQAYRKQFFKLMAYLNNVYLPQIDKAKGEIGGQCFALLQTFLSEFQKTGRMVQDPLIDKYK